MTNQARIDGIVLDWEQTGRRGPEYGHVQAGLQYIREATKMKESEIRQWIVLLEDIIQNSELETSEVKKNILEKIDRDLKLIQGLNKVVEQNKPKTATQAYGAFKTVAPKFARALDPLLRPLYQAVSPTATYALTHNKIQGILGYTHTFIESHFDDLVNLIANGTPIEGYDFTAVPLPNLDDAQSFYGSSKQVIFTSALIYMFLSYQNIRSLEEIKVNTHIDGIKRTLSWFDVSPFAHTTSIPNAIVEQYPDFKESTSYFQEYDPNHSHGLSFLSGGYAFGGGRNELRYNNNAFKKYVLPQDCSSFVARCIGLDPAHTTTNSLYEYFTNAATKECLETFSRHLVANCQDPQDPQEIKEGQLWVKKFKGGGHTDTVIGRPRSSEEGIRMLGCNRRMPGREGLGLETQPLHAQPDQTHLFFGVTNPKPTLPDVKDCVNGYTIQARR